MEATPNHDSQLADQQAKAIAKKVEATLVKKLDTMVKSRVADAIARHTGQITDGELLTGAGHESEPGQGLHSSSATIVSDVAQDPASDSQLSLRQLIQPLNVERGAGTSQCMDTSQDPASKSFYSPLIPPELAASVAYPFPLDARVSPRLKAKIIAREFVNFAELLDPKKAESNKLSLKASDEGHLVIVKDPGVVSFTQSVKSIAEWDRAFAIHSTTYATAHPLEIAQLLKYGERIKKISAQGGDWSHYDVGFRCLRQFTPIPWDYFHSEL